MSAESASSMSANTVDGTPREHAEKGVCLCDGPHHRMSWKWYLTMPGVEYVQLYLWILKDWSWSQLYWFNMGFVFGTLALSWLLLMISAALYYRIYSEAWIGLGVFMWIGGNFVWMVGDMLGNSGAYGSELGVEFFENCANATKYLLITATAWLGLYFLILPFQPFKDSHNAILRRMVSSSPPQRFSSYFRSFRDYETFHVLFWSMKDTLWVWANPTGYMIVFGIVIVLNLDLMFLLATYKNQYIDFVHCVVILLWVIANGVWAYGELNVEEDATDEDWEQYSFLHNQAHVFRFRNATGWIFFSSVSVIVLFYIQWIFVSVRKSVPSFEDQMKKDLLASGQASNEIKDQQTSEPMSSGETTALNRL